MSPDPSSTPSASQPPLPSGPAGSPAEGWRRSQRHFGRRGHPVHGIVPGLIVVAWGGLLMLRELGMISPHLRTLDFWPLLLVGFGLSVALRMRSVVSALFGLAAAVIGASMLAQRLGYGVPSVGRFWPLAIVAAGLVIIWRGLTHRHDHYICHRHDHDWGRSEEAASADVLERSVTMGSVKLTADSQQLKGAKLSATMGELKVDLRGAAIAGEQAAVDLALVMAGLELYVPSSWRVVSDVSPFMGTVEDRTDPRPDAAGVQKTLVLRGSMTMSAVTVSN